MLISMGLKLRLLMAVMILPFLLPAQDSVSVHEKYFRYRDRLDYFVVFVTEPGGGLLANIRNRDAWKDPDGIYLSGDEVDYHQSLTFGQTHTRTGYLLGTLATEYALLKQAGDTFRASVTLSQIRIVLDAFDRTDRCESGPPWFGKDTLDGFFVREDAPPVLSELMMKQLNTGLDDSDYFYLRIARGECGIPALIRDNAAEALKMYESRDGYFYSRREGSHPDAAAYSARSEQYFRYFKNQKFTSQDEVLGSLVGLTLTVKFVDDEDVRKTALDQMLRMISFMCGSRKTLWWRPTYPDGTRMGNENGADGRAYAFALKTLAYKYAGEDYLKRNFPAIVQAPWCRDAFEGAEYACLSNIGYSGHRIFRFLMAEALSVSGTSRVSQSVSKELKSFTARYDWDTFYLLLYYALNDLPPETRIFDFEKLSNQLQSAPADGTWQYGDNHCSKIKGWSAEFRWSATVEAQNGKTGENWSLGNYSGIDFMLLHNLACLGLEEYSESFSHYIKP